jgi:flagellar hook-associated protein 3 FlgL
MIRAFGAEKEQFLLDVERTQERARRAQMQISSGFRINTVSDAPGEIVEVLSLQVELARATQARLNLERTKTDVDTNEATLRNAIEILEQVGVLAARGAGTQPSASERQLLADRIQDWHSELVRIANSHHSGRYQFAGDLDQQAPYQLDWTQPAGVVRLQDPSNSRMIEDAAGNRYAVSRRAQDIFDLRASDGSFQPGNVFQAVYSLAQALDANDTAGVDTAIGLVKQASDHLNAQLSFYGMTQNRLKDSIDEAHAIEVRVTKNLSERRDADLPAAILELNQAEMSLQASMGAQSRLPRTSLFDYLA